MSESKRESEIDKDRMSEKRVKINLMKEKEKNLNIKKG